MNILVINAGSSSLKYQLFRMPSEKPACTGLVERIGQQDAFIRHKQWEGDVEKVTERTGGLPDHYASLHAVLALLSAPGTGVISSPEDIAVVGHRVVHGGEQFAEPAIITPAVKETIRTLFSLAPLHNPANYTCIEVAEKTFPHARQVAVFDTAFHQTMPPQAYRYALPEAYYREKRIRVYGFHGTSHKYVTQKAMAWLQKPDARLISIHLGNGCSMAAVDSGRSVDTSMGFGPLAGLIMGTRSGDIDPSVVFHLMEREGKTEAEISALLNKQSGLLGLTGTNDMRDIRKAVRAGDAQAALACDLYAYRVRKYIGAYTAVLNGLDAIIFTAGVGENDVDIRESICQNLDYLGIRLDLEKNRTAASGIRAIHAGDSRVAVLVVPTNEELEIAHQCYRLPD
ncbi:acetate/propionate family kinase [Parachryseolinea silvisoli]|uniref:acetate/propionate family kinase n=1 Tax=Parachryseolinea silvisoli TaxID=2873601 RepID=UPI002265F6C3|nr:acetate kinase [Parachryseolinea silvisoli]MCD9019119.1 acetate kinase [Parachryseolinea silvisoli]